MNRRLATGIIAWLCLTVIIVGPLLFRHASDGVKWQIAGFGAYFLVLAQSRSMLPWTYRLAGGRVLRRGMRIGVFLVPLFVVKTPFTKVSAISMGLGVAVGAIGLIMQHKEIRLGLSRRYIRILGPIDSVERIRDLIFFSSSGAAQEYLYRGILLAGLASLVGPSAVLICTLCFVVEHLAHAHARQEWDQKDIFLQTWLGLGFGTLTLAFNSIWAALAGHTLYNFPNVIQTVLRPKAQHLNTSEVKN